MKSICLIIGLLMPSLIGSISAQVDNINIISGSWTDAQRVSYKPDASHVAVFMIVDKGFKYSADELIPPLKTYFDYYGLPVIFVKQQEPADTDMCSIRIYINGNSVPGDLSTGNFSLLRIEFDHQNIFKRLRRIYDKANS